MNENQRIPVHLVTESHQLFGLDARTALLRLPENLGHGHADGVHCIACAASADVRTMLFDLLEEAKQGLRASISKVVIDISASNNRGQIVAALTGKLPAQALRDHTVARRFYLAG